MNENCTNNFTSTLSPNMNSTLSNDLIFQRHYYKSIFPWKFNYFYDFYFYV